MIYIVDSVGEARTMGFVRVFIHKGRMTVIEGLTNR
jgi:hypothetical protein